MKKQKKGRLIKTWVFLVYLIMNCPIVFGQLVSTGEDFRIGATTVKVSQGAEVSVGQGFSVSGNAVFTNDGSVYFNNNREETMDINTLLDGSGRYYVKGQADYILKGSGASVSYLSIEGGNTLWLEDGLSVTGNLNLADGVIDVAEGVELRIESTVPGAVSFDNSIDNTSFIQGTLTRNTEPGIEYIYPLGTYSEGFHPFAVRGVSSPGPIRVNYEPDFTDTWSEPVSAAFELETVGGWEVRTGENGASFLPGLSLYDNSYGILEGNYTIFYSANPGIVSPDFSLDFNSETQGAYLTTRTGHLAGTFALASIPTTPQGEEAVPVPELVNFLVRDGTGRTTFEVPGLPNYKKVVLSVYNRFGHLVYRSNAYGNDFDSRNYRSGTYFYELTLETNEGKKVLMRNIIEIMEHN